MSEHDQYHAAAYQSPSLDPRRLQPQTSAPSPRPPSTGQSVGYQQASSPYNPNLQQNHQSNAHQSNFPAAGKVMQEPGYLHTPPLPSPGQMGELSSQLGNMGIAGDQVVAARPNKKKNRHAHHNLDQSGLSSPTFNGPPYGQAAPSPYLNSDPSPMASSGHPYAGQPITPAMNQFPAQSTGYFSPGIQATSPGFGVQTPSFGRAASPMSVPSGPGVSAQGRVNPEQIPSIPKYRDGAAVYYLDHIYPTMEQHLPPPGVIPFVAHDQGNSSPKYARLTLNNIPSTSDALAATSLPLGLVLQPLASIQPGEPPIPVLDFGESGPPRCRRCRAYINPFMTFRSGGNKFVCNMCTFPNDVAPEYFAPTDPSGVRVDRAQRPELTTGTVEYLVPKEYWAKEPVPLHWLFLIDVSQEAVARGFLQAFCEGISGALYGNVEDDMTDENSNGDAPKRSMPPGSKVGFVTFDKTVQFYNCNVCPRKCVFSFSLTQVVGKIGTSSNAGDAGCSGAFCSFGQRGTFCGPLWLEVC